MKALPNGYFSDEWKSQELAQGLRSSSRMPRNNKFFTQCQGAVGYEGVLHTLDALSLSSIITASTDVTLDDFPFPQLFVLERHIIVCNSDSILELQAGALVKMIDSLTGDSKWCLASAHDWIYLSNGTVNVIRDPITKLYALDTTYPLCSGICNFNGQIIVGNPR